MTDGGTPTLALTEAQLLGDTAALATITGAYHVTVTGVLAADAVSAAAQTGVTSVSVSDTAANVAANIDALETLTGTGQLATVILTNGGTPTMTITATQLSADAAALALISSAHNLAVTIVLAANATSVGGQTHVTAVSVSDTAANVATIALDALQALGTKFDSGGLDRRRHAGHDDTLYAAHQ